MSLRFGESLLVTWLNVRTKRNIVYIAFLSLDFPQIATRLVATYVMRASVTPPRALSQNKLILLWSQLIVLSSNSSVVREAKHDS